MIVGLCDTQIGENPPILTKKLTKTKTKKSVKKSADFFGLEKSADFFGLEKSADFVVCVEIVWWDTSLRLETLISSFVLHRGVVIKLRRGWGVTKQEGRGASELLPLTKKRGVGGKSFSQPGHLFNQRLAH